VVIDGTVRQAGPQREVFARPADPQVARLLGVRNVCTTAVVRDGVPTGGDLQVRSSAAVPDGPAVCCVRLEGILLDPGAGTPAVVGDVLHLAGIAEAVTVTHGGTDLSGRLSENRTSGPGDTVRITVRPQGVTAWPICAGSTAAP
jgi:iron(III) transport system ATP-binding protein